MLHERATVGESPKLTTLLVGGKGLCLLTFRNIKLYFEVILWGLILVYYRLSVQSDIFDFFYSSMQSEPLKFRLAAFGDTKSSVNPILLD